MTELQDKFAEYKKIQQSGKRTDRARKLEEEIHILQKANNASPFDFDAMWVRIAKQGKPSVDGPPMDKPYTTPEPQVNFTVEQAKKLIGENDCAILDDCAKHAEARMIYLAHVLDKINPTGNANVARRGQATNIAIGIFNQRKENA